MLEFFRAVALFQANAKYSDDYANAFEQAMKFLDQIERQQQGSSCLHAVAKMGDLLSCRVLVNLNADVNLPNATGQTPLEIATVNGHPQLVQYFLESGAVLDNQTELVSLALSHGQKACAELLHSHSTTSSPKRPGSTTSNGLAAAMASLIGQTPNPDTKRVSFASVSMACVDAWKFVDQVKRAFDRTRTQGIIAPTQFDNFVQLMDLNDLAVSINPAGSKRMLFVRIVCLTTLFQCRFGSTVCCECEAPIDCARVPEKLMLDSTIDLPFNKHPMVLAFTASIIRHAHGSLDCQHSV